MQLLSFVSDLVPKHVPVLMAVEPPALSNSYAFDAPCSELFKVFSVKEKAKPFMAIFCRTFFFSPAKEFIIFYVIIKMDNCNVLFVNALYEWKITKTNSFVRLSAIGE